LKTCRIDEFRQSPVKHADETSWRTDGKNGYVWLFATPEISIFNLVKIALPKSPKRCSEKNLCLEYLCLIVTAAECRDFPSEVNSMVTVR
jgi:hypothetical protein